ncbi:multi-sensor signal transduction multi-kinase [Candidatus Magnetomorum sp. HK-1]|nr:multi-sensor signal transduction multi-kinase [Candidatus Magnetomorum sp. HK-1]
MKKLTGYSVNEELYWSRNTLVYRGERESDGQPIILKVLDKEYPSVSEIARFRHEYDILKELDIKGVINVLAMESYGNKLFLVMEDSKGNHSLMQIIEQKRFPIKDFLKIGIRITEAIGRIHEKHIIHKDLKPNNIIIHRETGEINLIDFGISTRLADEKQEITSADVIQGTLGYLSPEQTGRMNRSIDFRTDFYSLGMTFYEMLQGNLPFQENDAMGWVHAHIAKIPEQLCDKNNKIPKMVSDIVTKLISKNAEDRYQSAYGLKHDLEKCFKQLQKTGKIEDFSLGQRDIPWKLLIPQKLYGREHEINALMSVFDIVAQGNSEIMLVAGYSGIGKSVLVNEIQKPITVRRGYFISGKFDQFQKNIPYSAIIQAFRELVRQCLTESDENIQLWKAKLLKNFASNGQIIIDVIPEVELIVGQQPAIAELGPTESQNRFNMVFQNFINVFAQKDHPLVVFLDDLQWVDSASLNMIKTLITDPDSSYLFLMGAYRDNEVDKTHPLTMALEDIQKFKKVHSLFLKPLQQSQLNQLVSDTLYHEMEKCSPLAVMIFEKTGGNPFFVNEFLKSLYRKQLLKFNFDKGEWQWDLEKIKQQDITDNVVELMSSHILEIPKATQEVLKLAACIGNKFDLKVLSVAYEHSLKDTVTDIWKAIDDGLVISSRDFDSLYALACKEETDETILKKMIKGTEKFQHDRVQQAAYSLISKEKRKEMHLKIGWLLLEKTNEDELDETLFDIVGQLNNGWELIDNKKQKLKLVRLNLKAGKKAKNATAYYAGVNHLQIAINLLPENAWQEQYELMFEAKINLSEVSYLSGNFEAAEKLYTELLGQARSIEDKVRVHCIQMTQYHLQTRYLDALEVTKAGLSLMGLEIPDTEEKLKKLFQEELQKVPRLLGNRQIADLLYAPEMKDKNIKTTMYILTRLWISAYITGTNPTLAIYPMVKMTNLSLQYGNSEYSTSGYANYGMIASFTFGDYNTGYEFAKMSLKLCERFDNLAMRAQVCMTFSIFTGHWKQHFKSLLVYFEKGSEYAMQAGDFTFLAYNLVFLEQYSLLIGSNLDKLHSDAKTFEEIVRKYSPGDFKYFETMNQYIANLRTFSYDISTLNIDEFIEETDLLPLLLSWIYSPKIQLLYYFEDYDRALILAEQGEKMAVIRPSQPLQPETYFYVSLIYTECYARASNDDKQKYLETIQKYQEKMKVWANNCEANYLHKYLLVEAERARILHKDSEAMELYDQAIESAKEHEFIHHAALGNELEAKFWLNKGKDKFASLYMTEAAYLYQQWGATAKVKQLKEKYHKLFIQTETAKESYPDFSMSMTSTLVSNISDSSLDLNTVMKSSRSISSEIKLERLLDSFLKNIIENAGAQKGLLILENKGKFFIEAEKTADKNEIKVLQSEAVEQSEKLSKTIVNYVERTNENVVLNDAVNEGQFINTPYVQKNNPKSVLCSPIIYQDRVIGMVYLENNLATNAFTSGRLEVVNLLSSQAAISLENARLYANLEEKVEERTAQLKQARDALWGEMQLAKKIQTVLVPKKPAMKGYEISCIMSPADEVGGDYYDVINTSGRDWLVIGDVTGHGVQAGLIMMMVQSIINNTVIQNPNILPSDLLTKINITITKNIRSLEENRHMTIIVLSAYEDGKFKFSGLHEDIMIYRKTSKKVENIETSGMWIGIMDDIQGMLKDDELKLNVGDTMLLFTDGVTESWKKGQDREELFGDERLKDVFCRYGECTAEEIRNGILKELEGFDYDDDITMLVLKRIS